MTYDDLHYAELSQADRLDAIYERRPALDEYVDEVEPGAECHCRDRLSCGECGRK